METIHKAVIAGSFYPDNPKHLKQQLTQLLDNVSVVKQPPRAIIAPHAGYNYSGAIAATVYARLISAKKLINKVVLIGPSHHIGFKGLALSSAKQFMTPLGLIEIDREGIHKISQLPFSQFLDEAYDQEHSLEVHLPFLQTVIESFTLIPIITGNASAEQVCELIELFWEETATIIVISSDLSHFLDYESAQIKDKETSVFIEDLEYEKLDDDSACGRVAISGLLALARKNKLRTKTVDLRNSADTAGYEHKKRVVGYGAYVID
jgi:hypothetical protein